MISAFGIDHGGQVSKSDREMSRRKRQVAGAAVLGLSGGYAGRKFSGEGDVASPGRILRDSNPTNQEFASLMRDQKMGRALRRARREELKNIHGTKGALLYRGGYTHGRVERFLGRNKYTLGGAALGAVAGAAIAGRKKDATGS